MVMPPPEEYCMLACFVGLTLNINLQRGLLWLFFKPSILSVPLGIWLTFWGGGGWWVRVVQRPVFILKGEALFMTTQNRIGT